MTTINKKSYQPPSVVVVYSEKYQPLLMTSTIDILLDDTNPVDILDQDAPSVEDIILFDYD